MSRYMWKRRVDGVYLIDLHKTWQKLMLAARMIAAVENKADVCVISARPWGQRAVLKFAHYTGATAISGRFTPGTFTNQIQEKFMEPRLLILTDPRTDHQALIESSYANTPTIAFCHSDNALNHVDCAIPANNKARHSIGLMWWLLCREVLRIRGEIPRNTPWDVMVDLFFYRDDAERAEEEKEQAAVGGDVAAVDGASDWTTTDTTSGWDATQGQDWGAPAATTEWGSAEAAAPAAAAATEAAPAAGGWDIPTTGWDTAAATPAF
jgi:small subunit ribosomal protein SAe